MNPAIIIGAREISGNKLPKIVRPKPMKRINDIAVLSKRDHLVFFCSKSSGFVRNCRDFVLVILLPLNHKF